MKKYKKNNITWFTTFNRTFNIFRDQGGTDTKKSHTCSACIFTRLFLVSKCAIDVVFDVRSGLISANAYFDATILKLWKSNDLVNTFTIMDAFSIKYIGIFYIYNNEVSIILDKLNSYHISWSYLT